MGLYESRFTFFFLHFLQIVLLDLCAMFVIYYSGYSNWFTYLFAALLLTISQAQAGWLQVNFPTELNITELILYNLIISTLSLFSMI
jgi:hypothetical protein